MLTTNVRKLYIPENRIKTHKDALLDLSCELALPIQLDDFPCTRDDYYFVPRRFLDSMLRLINDVDAIGVNLEETCSMKHSLLEFLLGRPVSLKR